MKKVLLLSVLSLGMILAAHVADAQVHFYVDVPPPIPVYVHPVQPSPRHVWVESEFAWEGGRYVHHPGYWAVPPRHYHRWVRGYWQREPHHGNYWIPGHWDR